MRPLPPLNALRAFEAAARHLSFVQAGTELGVTSAAVSQQVRNLEDFLGKRMFVRQGNQLFLTDAGREVYPRLEQSLADIAALAEQVREGGARRRLVLSVLPSLAEHWLAPALEGYQSPGGLDLRVEDDPVAFARDGADLRLTYGAAYYAGHQVEELFTDTIVAVAAPGMADVPLEDLEEARFIHTHWGPNYVTQPSWANFFAHTGIRRSLDPARGTRVGQSGLALAVARAGLGVALVQHRMVRADLASGTLRQVHPTRMPMPLPYVAVLPHGRTRRADIRALVAHLLRKAAMP
ncbi:LysR substrate-binding domain-containing protein [Albidovulum sediminicola]|uniref:LysR substrate-binding domain-containing protein n=1 Tax=Albidovulum sediminicola TaxID=2984331 RepID=A0ABT2YY82_9RHOB|nr:LysR substrate-binding domain-containing protein [Defluviimonas sp. WL0075]MCV2863837.1 LysR substrate-binding domain-containing protein [Defluviimonas sp. WL0075]